MGRVYKIKKEDDIIVICERWAEARDNGYSFFKYLRNKYPDKPVYYIIESDEDNIDYQKILPLGNILPYNSIKMFVYLFYARYILSTHGVVNNTVDRYFGHWHQKTTYFLQHGVIKDDLGTYYTHSIARFDTICSGSIIEHAFLQEMSKKLKVTPIYTGLARWDRHHTSQIDKDIIMVMPTWRSYLVRPVVKIKDINQRIEIFKDSYFFQSWQRFLDSTELHQMLSENNTKMVFFPHPEVYRNFKDSMFISSSEHISIMNTGTADIMNLIDRSKMIITDFSSVFWEFAYTKRPVIYYQFDEERFRQGHHKKGYFDYRDDGFGAVVDDVDSLLVELKRYIDNGFTPEKKYLDRAKKHFVLHDDKNCERIYQELINFEKPVV